MDKLRPVEDVWDELCEVDITDEVAVGIIQADRRAHEEISGRNVDRALSAAGCPERFLFAACVAIVPETTRERLGRAVREEWVRWAKEQENSKPSWLIPWETLPEDQREVDCRIAKAVRAELAKIKEEQKL